MENSNFGSRSRVWRTAMASLTSKRAVEAVPQAPAPVREEVDVDRERRQRFHKRQRRFAKKFLAELREKDEDLLPSEKHQELMLQEEPLPVRFRCTGHPPLGKDAPSSTSMKVAMAFYLTQRGPGQAAGKPNFGRLVLGCIDAEFFK